MWLPLHLRGFHARPHNAERRAQREAEGEDRGLRVGPHDAALLRHHRAEDQLQGSVSVLQCRDYGHRVGSRVRGQDRDNFCRGGVHEQDEGERRFVARSSDEHEGTVDLDRHQYGKGFEGSQQPDLRVAHRASLAHHAVSTADLAPYYLQVKTPF